jgi:hypothetical protein
MRCDEKNTYPTRFEAESVGVGLIAKHRQAKRLPSITLLYVTPPTHVYRCPICDRWHLTSHPERLGQDFATQTYPLIPPTVKR